MPLDIERIVTKSLERLNDEHSKKRTLGRYYPSECWSCLRQKWFRWNQYPEETSKPLGIFEMGRRAEDALFAMLQKHYSEERVLNNIPVKIQLKDYCIAGETDPVLYKDGTQKKIQTIFEIKSTANTAATTETHDNHLRQLMCYLKGLHVDYGYVIYVNRADIQDVKAFEVKYDEVIWDSIVTHLDMFHEYVKNKEIPPAHPMAKWECRYCAYKDQCIEVNKKEK